MKKVILIMLIALSLLAVACSSSSNDGPRVVSNGDSSNGDSVNTDSGSNAASSGTTDSGSENSNSNSGLTQTEQVCYSYISKDKLDSILKADMYANDYSSGLGECDYKKTETTDENVLQGTQIRITKRVGREWYDKQKEALSSDNDFQEVSGIGDEAFVTGLLGWGSFYVLKDGNTWFVSLYTGDENLIPAIADLNADYNDVNRQNVADQKLAVLKQLAMVVGE